MIGGAALARVACFAASLLWVGCFVGYDSRWGQQKQAQQHAAQRSTPKQLSSEISAAPHAAHRVLKLRAYATPSYSMSVVDWRKQFTGLVERANAFFLPEFGAELEVEELRTFPDPVSEDKLDGLLQHLSALDPASDVDWVVGLAVAFPRFAVSADDLGIARLPGRHIVLRAMSDAHEYEAITRGFSELSEDERQKLYRVRKQHKLFTTFLHELAHTLGVPHELSATSLMNPRYHVEAGDFSDEAAQIIRASLASRASPSSPLLDAALAANLDTRLRAPDSDWEPLSRDALLAQLSQFSAPPPKPRTQASMPAVSAVAGLSASEQQSFDAARSELSAGHAAHARELAAPLFTKYSALPAVQSLRCDTAMAVGGDWEAISAECAGLSPFGAGQ